MNKLNVSIIAILAMLAAGCSDGGSSSGSHTFSDKTASEQVKVSYRFSLNGCDTGLQNFFGHSHSETVKSMCEGLQNDVLNNSCSETLRRDYFNWNCQGTFTVNYGSSESTEKSKFKKLDPNDWRNDRELTDIRLVIQNSLDLKFVDQVTFFGVLAIRNYALAKEISEIISDCGLQRSNIGCFESQISYRINAEELVRIKGQYKYITKLSSDEGSELLVVYDTSSPRGHVSVDSATFYLINSNKNLSIQEFGNILNQQTKLFSVTFHADKATGLQKKVAQLEPMSFRALYGLVRNSQHARIYQGEKNPLSKSIALQIENNMNAVTAGTPAEQIEFIETLSYTSNFSNTLLTVSENLKDSKNEEVAAISAITIFESDKNRIELKAKIFLALKSENKHLIKRALNCIKDLPSINSDETDAIVSLVGDEDYYVGEAAGKVLSKKTISEKSLPAIKKLLSSNQRHVKFITINLLEKIKNSQEALDLLIHLVGDEDYYVGEAAGKVLSKKTISEKSLPAIKKLLTSNQRHVKFITINLLEKIENSQEALDLLIQLVGDEDYYVGEAAGKVLSKKTISEKSLSAIKKLLSSNQRHVKFITINLLEKIENSQEALDLLIQLVGDEDYYVGEAAGKVLSKKTITEKSIPSIKTLLFKDARNIKLIAIRLLEKIGNSESNQVLEDQLKVESDWHVTEAIKKALGLK